MFPYLVVDAALPTAVPSREQHSHRRSAEARKKATTTGRRRKEEAEKKVDSVLADSFPASDPPSWTSGIARPGSSRDAKERAAATLFGHAGGTEIGDSATTGVPGPDINRRTLVHSLVSLTGAVGVALLMPIAILLIGLPIAISIRAMRKAISWIAELILR
jgi:hypothetical protein